jgi:hypothetical protein
MSFSRFGGRLAFSGPYDGESDLLDRLADPSPP